MNRRDLLERARSREAERRQAPAHASELRQIAALVEQLTKAGHSPEVIERVIAGWVRERAPTNHEAAAYRRAIAAATATVARLDRRAKVARVAQVDTLEPSASWRPPLQMRDEPYFAGLRESVQVEKARLDPLVAEARAAFRWPSEIAGPVREQRHGGVDFAGRGYVWTNLEVPATAVPGVYAVQRDASAAVQRASALDAARALARLGAGEALPAALRARVRRVMPARLAVDLDRVRLHRDAAAAELCRELGARALALGEHIAFAPGMYDPASDVGFARIVHEMVHVAQQARGQVHARGAELVVDDAALEAEAWQVGHAALAPSPAAPTPTPAAPVDASADVAAGETTRALAPAAAQLCACEDDEEDEDLAHRERGAEPVPAFPEKRLPRPCATTADALRDEAFANLARAGIEVSAVFVVADWVRAFDRDARDRGGWGIFGQPGLTTGYWFDGGSGVDARLQLRPSDVAHITGGATDDVWVVGPQWGPGAVADERAHVDDAEGSESHTDEEAQRADEGAGPMAQKARAPAEKRRRRGNREPAPEPELTAAPAVMTGTARQRTSATPTLIAQIRQRYPKGIAVVVSIPAAFTTVEDARPTAPGASDGQGWESAWFGVLAHDETFVRRLWQGRHPGDPVPTGSARTRAVKELWDHEHRAICEELFVHHLDAVAARIKSNNDELPSQARIFARDAQTVGLDADGAVTLGKAMIYARPSELVQHVLATSQAVRALFDGEPDAERVAQVRALGIFAHGSRSWMGGNEARTSHARDAGFHTDYLGTLLHGGGEVVEGLDGVLADDVRVMLFACSTAHADGEHAAETPERDHQTEVGRRPHDENRAREERRLHGEGGLADSLRDLLVRERRHAHAIVGGHVEDGHCVRNQVRFFHGQDAADTRRLETRFLSAWRKQRFAELFGREASEADLARFFDLLILFQRRELAMYVETKLEGEWTPTVCVAAFERFFAANEARVRLALSGGDQHAARRDGPPTRTVENHARHGLAGEGEPVDAALAERFFQATGVDVSHALVHRDAAAHAGARALDTSAYTYGNHIAFAGSPSHHLVFHELAHVAQQTGRRADVVAPGTQDAETEARAAADAIVAMLPAVVTIDRPLQLIADGGERAPRVLRVPSLGRPRAADILQPSGNVARAVRDRHDTLVDRMHLTQRELNAERRGAAERGPTRATREDTGEGALADLGAAIAELEPVKRVIANVEAQLLGGGGAQVAARVAMSLAEALALVSGLGASGMLGGVPLPFGFGDVDLSWADDDVHAVLNLDVDALREAATHDARPTSDAIDAHLDVAAIVRDVSAPDLAELGDTSELVRHTARAMLRAVRERATIATVALAGVRSHGPRLAGGLERLVAALSGPLGATKVVGVTFTFPDAEGVAPILVGEHIIALKPEGAGAPSKPAGAGAPTASPDAALLCRCLARHEDALRLMSTWDLATITATWRELRAQSRGDRLADFLSSLPLTLVPNYLREVLGIVRVLDAAERRGWLVRWLTTRWSHEPGPDEALAAFLALRDLAPATIAAVRAEVGVERWTAFSRRLPTDAADRLATALEPHAEAQRAHDVAARRAEARADADVLKANADVSAQVDELASAMTPAHALALRTLLASASKEVLAAIVHRLEVQGLVDAWIDALPPAERWSPDGRRVLLAVMAQRSPAAALMRVEELVSTGVFDWAVTSEEAKLAYWLVRSQPPEVQASFAARDDGRWLARVERGMGRALDEGTSIEEAGSPDQLVAALAHLDEQSARDAWTQLLARASVMPEPTALAVHQLDARGLFERMLATAGFAWLFAGVRRADARLVFELREPWRSIEHIMRLTEPKPVTGAGPSCDEAYLGFELYRALSVAEREALAARQPARVQMLWQRQNASQRGAADASLYRSAADSGRILAQLEAPSLWAAQGAAADQQLGNVLRMAMAAGLRRRANELAIAHDGFATHEDLLLRLGFIATMDAYGEAGVASGGERVEGREGMGEWSLAAVPGAALAMDTRFDRSGQTLNNPRLDLEPVQDAMGGSLAGARLARRRPEDQRTNALVNTEMRPDEGLLHTSAPTLRLASFQRMQGQTSIRTGEGALDGVVIDACWQTPTRPDQNNRFFIHARRIVFEDIEVIGPGSMTMIAKLTIADLDVTTFELPVPTSELARRDAAQQLLRESREEHHYALLDVLRVVGVLGDYSTIAQVSGGVGAAIAGPGGQRIAFESLAIEGLTTSSGTHADTIALGRTEVRIEHLPSRLADTRCSSLEATIERNEARCALLQRLTAPTENDRHELARLARESDVLRDEVVRLRSSIPALQAREHRYLELYRLQRENRLPPEAVAELDSLQREMTGGVVADVASLAATGIGTDRAGVDGSVEAHHIRITGESPDVLPSLVTQPDAIVQGVTPDGGARIRGALDVHIDDVQARNVGSEAARLREARRQLIAGRRLEELRPEERARLEALDRELADAAGAEAVHLRGVHLGVGGSLSADRPRALLDPEGRHEGGGVMSAEVGELEAFGVTGGGARADRVYGAGLRAEGVGVGELVPADPSAYGFSGRGDVAAEHLRAEGVRRGDERASAIDVRGASTYLGTDQHGEAGLAVGSLDVEGVRHGDEASGDVHLRDFRMGVEGLGAIGRGGWDIAGQTLTLDVHLGALTIENLRYRGELTLEAAAVGIEGLFARASVRIDRADDGTLRAVPLTLHDAVLVGADALGLYANVPVERERLALRMPHATLSGLRARGVSLAHLDPLTFAGSFQLDHMRAALSADIGDYFHAGAGVELTDLKVDALESGELKVHLGDLTLDELGFGTSGEVPPGSIVARLRERGVWIERIAHVGGDVTYDRRTGDVDFAAHLGDFALRRLDWRAGDVHVWVDGRTTFGGVRVSGQARVGEHGPEIVRFAEIHVARLAAPGLHYHDPGAGFALDLERGALEDFTVSDFVPATMTGRVDLRHAEITNLGMTLQSVLEDEHHQRVGETILRSNLNANVRRLHAARAHNGRTTLRLAELDASATAEMDVARGERHEISGGQIGVGVRGLRGAAEGRRVFTAHADRVTAAGHVAGGGASIDFEAVSRQLGGALTLTDDGLTLSVTLQTLTLPSFELSSDAAKLRLGGTTTARGIQAKVVGRFAGGKLDTVRLHSLDMHRATVGAFRLEVGERTIETSAESTIHGLHVFDMGDRMHIGTSFTLRGLQTNITDSLSAHMGSLRVEGLEVDRLSDGRHTVDIKTLLAKDLSLTGEAGRATLRWLEAHGVFYDPSGLLHDVRTDGVAGARDADFGLAAAGSSRFHGVDASVGEHDPVEVSRPKDNEFRLEFLDHLEGRIHVWLPAADRLSLMIFIHEGVVVAAQLPSLLPNAVLPANAFLDRTTVALRGSLEARINGAASDETLEETLSSALAEYGGYLFAQGDDALGELVRSSLPASTLEVLGAALIQSARVELLLGAKGAIEGYRTEAPEPRHPFLHVDVDHALVRGGGTTQSGITVTLSAALSRFRFEADGLSVSAASGDLSVAGGAGVGRDGQGRAGGQVEGHLNRIRVFDTRDRISRELPESRAPAVTGVPPAEHRRHESARRRRRPA